MPAKEFVPRESLQITDGDDMDEQLEILPTFDVEMGSEGLNEALQAEVEESDKEHGTVRGGEYWLIDLFHKI